MNMYWIMYFITRLNGIRSFLEAIYTIGIVLIGIIGIVYIAAIFMSWMAEEEEIIEKLLNHWHKVVKALIWMAIPTVIFGLLWAATPTMQDAAVIYIVPKIIQNEQLAELPNKGLEFLNSQLDVWIKENLKEKMETGNKK